MDRNEDKCKIRKFKGIGEELDRLDWDVKSYFLMGGAMHDAAISAWGSKGYYDYARPISVIRYLSENGQSTHEDSTNYNPNGFPLIEGYIEMVSLGDPLVGENNKNLGKVKLYTWKGFSESTSSDVEKGSGWILAEEWWPYQRPSFVTPPFAGYVSGHSVFSRAAAVIMESITGSAYFPGGMGTFHAEANEFLVFEDGPSIDIELQWATYRDASDQTSLSRIYGGIHPPIDDLPGRYIGEKIGYNVITSINSIFNIDILSQNTFEKSSYIFPSQINNHQKITARDTSTIQGIEIYSINGQLIKKINGNRKLKQQVHIEASPGIYLVNIISENSTNSHRVQIIK